MYKDLWSAQYGSAIFIGHESGKPLYVLASNRNNLPAPSTCKLLMENWSKQRILSVITDVPVTQESAGLFMEWFKIFANVEADTSIQRTFILKEYLNAE